MLAKVQWIDVSVQVTVRVHGTHYSVDVSRILSFSLTESRSLLNASSSLEHVIDLVDLPFLSILRGRLSLDGTALEVSKIFLPRLMDRSRILHPLGVHMVGVSGTAAGEHAHAARDHRTGHVFLSSCRGGIVSTKLLLANHRTAVGKGFRDIACN